MKFSGVAAVLSVTIVTSTLVFVATSNHKERLPDAYYSLDKGRPWNELTTSLDPRMSEGEYDAMRTQYFNDVVAPKVPHDESTVATYEEFMQLTDRPWRWDRRPSRGDPTKWMLIVFWISAAYLMVLSSRLAWKVVLKPVGLALRNDGLVGVAQLLLHGRKSQ
jgi:hypothetical protein